MSDVTLIKGDATERWPLPDNSLDSIVTDPPYGIAFMGKEWDDKGGLQAYQEWTAKWASEAFRCLKPGGFLLAFGATRMAHRMACGFEDAGFRIADTIEWLYLTGFPKAQDISKMIDKRAGVKPLRVEEAFGVGFMNPEGRGGWNVTKHRLIMPDATTPFAKKWDGWKTPNLKPAHEPIIMAQKPFKGTFCDNIERWGVGAINVDGCRIPVDPADTQYFKSNPEPTEAQNRKVYGFAKCDNLHKRGGANELGRFPANVVTLDEDEWYSPYFNITPRELSKKAGPAERNGDGWRNNHPTVKPVELARWLQRLVTPPDGTTASPFMGSGTDAVAAILEGFNFWGMELDMTGEYWPIIEARVAEAKRKVESEKQSRSASEQVRLF